MSGQNAQRTTEYDPLPLNHEDHQEVNAPYASYNPPSSPGLEHHTPQDEPFNPPQFDSSSNIGFDSRVASSTGLPLGAGQPQPRFMGTALYNDPGAPYIRDSYASQGSMQYASSDRNSSVFALNADPMGALPGRDQYGGEYRDDPRDSSYFAGQESGHAMSSTGSGSRRYMEEKRSAYAPKRSKRKVFILAICAAGILLIAAVLIPLYFAVIKPKSGASSSGSGSSASPSSTASGTPGKLASVTGGDGSKVTMDDGSTFTYVNKFGGNWYWDENDPFNNNAQAQSWSPPLNTTFKFGVDKIRGVNLGGWLTTEPFISPALFEPYLNNTVPPVDEWTLSQAMAADTANGGLTQLEKHYKTFITEKDFAEIAGAGLNWVRIPLPYWAIEVWAGEPFLPKTSWTYFLKAIQWARKYGIRINLDFHALPGSQNGWNHSGRLGTINVLNGPMGIANAQRSLDYIRIIAEFISQPQYSDVVAMFGITNEPQGPKIGQENLARYYLQAYANVRTASGTGEGNGPFVSFHEGFEGLANWAGYFPGADRVALDYHPYLCFKGQSAAPMSSYATTPCAWGSQMNTSMSAFGLTGAGEWSNAVTDCGLWVNGVNLGQRYDGTYTADGNTWPSMGSCTPWTDWANYSADTKKQINAFALASMDALQNWFFWTWKIGNSSITNTVESPAWSYQLGLEQGWMPTDPRTAAGVCGNGSPWVGPLSAYQTGGAGAGTIPASFSSSYAWPPTSISNGGPAAALPTYTPTGTLVTLPGPTFTPTATGGKAAATATLDAGSGWKNKGDTASGMVPIATCSYLDPWVGSANPPSPLCSGSAKRETGWNELVAPAVITQAPKV